MARISSFAHRDEDGAVHEFELGAKAENVLMPDGSGLPSALEGKQECVSQAPEKTVPADADSFAVVDSADDEKTKRITWASIISAIKNVLDNIYVRATRNVNNKPLTSDITLNAEDVGARADDWTPTKEDVGLGKALTFTGAATGTYDGTVAKEVNIPEAGGKRTCRFTVGTSAAGWTAKDCDYLCDGTADQVEINAAIQALPAGGGEVVILDGTYNITATIAMNKANVKLSGNGNATVLKRMWHETVDLRGLVTVTASENVIKYITIDGNADAYSSGLDICVFMTSTNNIITKIVCKNNGMKANGIRLNVSSGNAIVNNTCENCLNGISLNYSDDNKILGNTCKSNANGISVSTSSDCTISCNICNNNIARGIISNLCINAVFANNTCNNGKTGIQLSTVKNCVLSANTCNNNNDEGIYIISCSNNVVLGNVCIRGAGLASDYTDAQRTIWLRNTDNEYNLIANNMIMGKNYVDDGGTGNAFVNNKHN